MSLDIPFYRTSQNADFWGVWAATSTERALFVQVDYLRFVRNPGLTVTEALYCQFSIIIKLLDC